MKLNYNKNSINFLNTSTIIVIFVFLFLPQPADAAADRSDFDLDDDGLIEINDLSDLDAIRSALDGASLYGESTGCPSSGCIGFELVNDLNFDSNGSGEADEGDTYWNSGRGWLPIGAYEDDPGTLNTFTATFQGNGYEIKNLHVDRPDLTSAGLFAAIENAQIFNTGLTGDHMLVRSTFTSGSLVGSGHGSLIRNCYAMGRVQAFNFAGGLIGLIGSFGTTLTVENSFFSGTISSHESVDNANDGGILRGGIVGFAFGDTLVKNSFATGLISGNRAWNIGGIIGSIGGGEVENSFFGGRFAEVTTIDEYSLFGISEYGTRGNNYWNLDSIFDFSMLSETTQNGFSLKELQCPTSANNSLCSDRDLYVDWDEPESAADAFWDFGDEEELPGLVLNGRLFRDADGDGTLDAYDAFPKSRAAALDANNNGYPDEWVESCDLDCQLQSGLVLDESQVGGKAAGSLKLDYILFLIYLIFVKIKDWPIVGSQYSQAHPHWTKRAK